MGSSRSYRQAMAAFSERLPVEISVLAEVLVVPLTCLSLTG